MSSLTDEQKAFLDAEGKVILCACPGSGKTYVVGKKLLKYLASWPHTHRGVAVLSFTNIASKEIMRQTVELSGGTTQTIGLPHYIGTLDSFIDSFIFLRFGYMMYSQDKKRPKIIYGNFGSIPYPKKECYTAGCVQNPDWFHWGENYLLKNNQRISCSVSSSKPCISYKKAMLKGGFVTQREVPALALRLLKMYPQIVDEIAYRFPVIIIMIGSITGLTSETIRHTVELKMDYTVWKKTVLSILTALPKQDEAICVWSQKTRDIIRKMVESGTIVIRNSHTPESLIKTKSRVRISGKYSAEFLEQPLYKYFEKRTSKGTVVSSVHGVKGETFDATLLLVDAHSGKTITPSFLSKGDLNSELMRIAYVAMTRPRKILVVAMPKTKSKKPMNRFPKDLWDYIEV